jgi:hypothetical protein
MRSCKTNVEEFNKLWQVPDEDGYRKRNLYEDVVQVSTTASADMEVGSNGTCYPQCMYSKEPSKLEGLKPNPGYSAKNGNSP